MAFDLTGGVHAERGPDGTVRHLRHLHEPYVRADAPPRRLAAEYVRDVAELYRLSDEALSALEPAFRESDEFTGEPARLRFAGEQGLLGTTTISYVQTFGGLAVWEAGLAVTVQAEPNRATSSYTTFHYDLELETPAQNGRTYDRDELADRLRFAGSRIAITSQRRLIYRYETARRFDSESRPRAELEREGQVPLGGPKPTLGLPAPPPEIVDGQHYVVTEILFTTDEGQRNQLHWRVFIEERTGAVLYARALLACVAANVFLIDPVTTTGNGELSGCSGDMALDPEQASVTLALTAATPQPLTGKYVMLTTFRDPTPPPVSPPTNFASLASSSAEFGAVNAYYHVDRFFRLMNDLGIDPATYFSGTSLPLQVDHVDTTGGFLAAWTYANPGGVGCSGIGFGYTKPEDTCASPVRLGCDLRVAFHECSHLILLERTHDYGFGFCHSTGDSLAAIFADPETSAPDRFATFPFVPFPRRHDRAVAAWAWGGSHDDFGYASEEILTTTQFRVYRSAGGDDERVPVRRYASNLVLYLIIRAVGSLGPATITPTPSPDVWATALMNADTGTTTFDGVPGGTAQKMIRWAFEKQGLYQPANAPEVVSVGAPPDVDVYIDDGRSGEYTYLEVFWNNTEIWNRIHPDGMTGHDAPVVGVPSFAYVRVKNRGTKTANNVRVFGYHADPAAGLSWPDDWIAMTTASLPASAIPPGGSTIVGPFKWTPQFEGHECLFMAVSADGDRSNIDPATALPCAVGPTPHWRLVPFDNNLGQRNVAPVAGGGATHGLLASFHNRTFTARNPLDRTARIVLEAVLPAFLKRAGWSVRYTSAGGDSFSLPARGARKVEFTLVAGADFTPADVPQGKDPLIAIHMRIDGLLVGGMSYAVDRELREPPRDLPRHPDGEKGEYERRVSLAVLAACGLLLIVLIVVALRHPWTA